MSYPGTRHRVAGSGVSGMTEVKAAFAVLKHCSSRIMHTAEEALHLWEVWSTFDQAAELRPASEAPRRSLLPPFMRKPLWTC